VNTGTRLYMVIEESLHPIKNKNINICINYIRVIKIFEKTAVMIVVNFPQSFNDAFDH
jgi:hypothetical protein